MAALKNLLVFFFPPLLVQFQRCGTVAFALLTRGNQTWFDISCVGWINNSKSKSRLLAPETSEYIALAARPDPARIQRHSQ